ncbi:PREDICTED: uncharacterized protein LOC109353934 isoform X2 [Lupinus angustifolius]|uniref:uncharacterized protein LOC109353934 isoform X2 n=1 Tax=Lupinus angustifolius TaxID=3871 RepID=UPI00092E3B5A|nr:PREDICTED: uncharacterized protein LOC109353934 isoform X2 [Lupinus angustifolius]
MDLWNRARSFVEETAKGVNKQSQHLSFATSKFTDIIAETKEIASQASNQIKYFAETVTVNPNQNNSQYEDEILDLEIFGITEELREFVKGITVITFRDFPIQDDTELSDVPAVSNVRQDLTEWQQKHACLVLSTVKEISKLRYELCPRVMKERKFWRIYFILLNNHIAPYENQYIEDAKLKSSEQVKDHEVTEPSKVELTSNQEEVLKVKKETKTSTSSTEQDLDVFLLGDTGDSDNDSDDGDGDFDDDLDKLIDSSDDEKGKS